MMAASTADREDLSTGVISPLHSKCLHSVECHDEGLWRPVPCRSSGGLCDTVGPELHFLFRRAQSIKIGTTSAKWNPKISSSVCDKVPFSPPDFRPLPKIVTRRPGLNLNSSCPESRQLKIVSPLTQTPEGKGAPMLCGIVYEGDEPIPFCTKG
jgi:hypothetical protein